MLGSALAGWLPAHVVVAGLAVGWASNLPLVFFLSGALRLGVSMVLLGTFHEGRRVESISARELLVQLPVIKPLTKTFAGIK
jgi:hypothetical protein